MDSARLGIDSRFRQIYAIYIYIYIPIYIAIYSEYLLAASESQPCLWTLLINFDCIELMHFYLKRPAGSDQLIIGLIFDRSQVRLSCQQVLILFKVLLFTELNRFVFTFKNSSKHWNIID